MSNETEDVNDGSFAQSPYPLSILPRIRHVKPRPSRTKTTDLPPTPSRDVHHRERSAIVVEAEGSQCCGISETGLGTAVGSHNPKRQIGNERQVVDSMENSTRSSSSWQKSVTKAPFDRRKPTLHSKNIEVIQVTDSLTHSQSTKQGDKPIISDHSTNEGVVCSICNKNIARYTCPKCQALYCSVACYRLHDGGGVFDSYGRQIIDTEWRGGVCTELFYKDRVLSEYKSLKSEGDDVKLRGILARMHRDINDGLDNLELQEESLSKMLRNGEESSNFSSSIASDLNLRTEPTSLQLSSGNSSAAEISDEELAELAAYVLQMEDNETDSSDNGAGNEEDDKNIIDCIPPHLLYAFECDLASASALPNKNNQGELESAWKPFLRNDTPMPEVNDQRENETIRQSPKEEKTITSSIKRQKGHGLAPWWMPLVEKNCSTDEDTRSESPTLDERILSLRAFPKLNRGTAPISSLAYNIVEVLYSTSFSIRATTRLSSKIDDEEGTSIYQAALLLSHSLVLSKDARYNSVGDALSSSSEQLINLLRTIPKENMNNSHLSWESLASDVAKLSRNRRYVLRMLFDASDICDAAIVHIKKNLKSMKTKRLENVDSIKKEYEESKKSYKLALKKIEYFQSWSSSLWTVELGRTISDEAYAFIDDWKWPDINTAAETPVETFLRHVNGDEATKEKEEKRERDTTFSLGSDFFRLDLKHNDNLMKNHVVSISTTRRKKSS